VLTANLDKLYWHQHNQGSYVREELRTLREMVALLTRTFYNHMPEIPESQRQAAAISGEKRFNQFLEVLVMQIGPGQSALERMPEPAMVTADDVPDPNDDADDVEKDKHDDTDDHEV